MFPIDATTTQNIDIVAGSTNYTLIPSGQNTILEIMWDNHYGDTTSGELDCNGNEILDTHQSGSFIMPTQYLCNGAVTEQAVVYSKSADFKLVYVPRNTLTTSAPFNPSSMNIDIPTLDLFLGFALFFAVFYLILCLFMKR